jgi:hypothetical protein
MNEYNYQRMVEEITEEYERTLPADPDERELLADRVENRRKDLRISAFKNLIIKHCSTPGLDNRYLMALMETPDVEEYLQSVKTEILTRIAKAERAMELDAARDPEPHEIH